MQNNMSGIQSISGNIVDVVLKTITKGIVIVEDGKIKNIIVTDEVEDQFIIPG